MARRIAVWYYLSPTDAVVVLSLLHAATIKLKLLITATLEIDSGSNDPLAVLLTISIIEMLQARKPTINLIVFQSILLEIGLGALIGITAGYLIIWFANRIKVAESLYPLLVLSSDMLIFSSTNLLGGSGYLAIYLGGIIISNNQIHQRENILRLHDSLAQLSQIGMFLMLGLFVTPSALLPNMFYALCIALALIFIARPAAVWISLFLFPFNWQEKLFIAWTGLRGAIPIILAINPLLVGLKHADLYFNITFFIVIISIILQGWTLPTLAHWLKVD